MQNTLFVLVKLFKHPFCNFFINSELKMQTKAQLDREIDLVYCLLFIPNRFGVIAQQYDWGVEKKFLRRLQTRAEEVRFVIGQAG